MTDFSAKWAMTIYAKLWVKFGTKKFSRKDAEKVIKSSNLPQVFSPLKRDGWLTMEIDSNDGRKNLYTLRDPKEVVEGIGRQS